MPASAMVAKGNDQLAAQSVPKILAQYPKEVERLGQPGTLVPVARTVLKLTNEEAEYLEAIPSALRESMRASIYDALSNGKSVQLQYTPGYDFSVQVWDYGEAVSIHIKGPYEAGSYSGRPERYSEKKATKRKTSVRKAVKRKPAKRKPARKSATRARRRGR